MGRSHGRLKTSIWSDNEWRALPMEAQWCYVMLLSQPRLSLVGVLDLMPGRWAKFAESIPAETVRSAIEVLADARFVVIDDDTEELLIRTMVVHDIAPSRMNGNLLKGFWSAWECVVSDHLRQVIVDHIPDTIWVNKFCEANEEAEGMRRSVPLEPTVETYGSDYRSPPTVGTSFRLSPSPFAVPSHQSPDNDPALEVSVPAIDNSPSTGPDPTYQQVVRDACLLLAQMQTDGPCSEDDWTSTIEGLFENHREHGLTLVMSEPSLTPRQLAFRLDPVLAVVPDSPEPETGPVLDQRGNIERAHQVREILRGESNAS